MRNRILYKSKHTKRTQSPSLQAETHKTHTRAFLTNQNTQNTQKVNGIIQNNLQIFGTGVIDSLTDKRLRYNGTENNEKVIKKRGGRGEKRKRPS